MQFGNKSLDLSTPVVMGILNVTPDSFSDGGRFCDLPSALMQASRMAAEGAVMIDVGGESTRPGASPVSVAEELDRVCPVVEAIARELDIIVSVDTSSPEVIREVARLGAGLINDVRSLSRQGAMEAAVESGLPVCVMHMAGEPQVMQDNPRYKDVVAEVRGYLERRVAQCMSAGMAADRIILDPGFGFGKTTHHNLLLLQGLESICSMGFPVLVGLSRKSMIGAILDRQVEQRAVGSAAAAAIAVHKGAAIVRAHDVRENADAVKVAAAIRGVKRDG